MEKEQGGAHVDCLRTFVQRSDKLWAEDVGDGYYIRHVEYVLSRFKLIVRGNTALYLHMLQKAASVKPLPDDVWDAMKMVFNAPDPVDTPCELQATDFDTIHGPVAVDSNNIPVWKELFANIDSLPC